MLRTVTLDVDIVLRGGGRLSGRDVALALPDTPLAEAALADAVLRALGLPAAESVVIRRVHGVERETGRAAARLVDLSHTIEHGLVTYKGLPPPIVCDYLTREDSRRFYAPGTEFQIGKIEMVTNTGTYLDCPFHRYADGKDMSEIGLDRLTDLETVVIRADFRGGLAVDRARVAGQNVRGRAVLVHTGWGDSHWNTAAYYEDHPFLTADAAQHLMDAGAVLVGIDSHNIDDTRGNSRPVHSTLLGADILIVEHLHNLGALPDAGARFTAAPPKFRGVGTFPVRAFARVDLD